MAAQRHAVLSMQPPIGYSVNEFSHLAYVRHQIEWQIAFIYETDPMLVLTRNVEKQLFTVHVVVEVEGKGRINLGYGSGGTEHMAHLAVLDGLMVEAAEHIRANGFNSIGVPIDETAKEWKLRAR